MNELNDRLAQADKAFDDYYARGGQGLADDVWRRIAIRFGVLGVKPAAEVTA